MLGRGKGACDRLGTAARAPAAPAAWERPVSGPPQVESVCGENGSTSHVSFAGAAVKVGGMADEQDSVRVDVWLWSVRLVKTRSMATAACRGGHVKVNNVRVKPSTAVRPGDEVRLRLNGRERIVVVQRIIRKRVGASVAAECLIDKSPPPPPREVLLPVAQRERGSGRPTKRERRQLERFRNQRFFG